MPSSLRLRVGFTGHQGLAPETIAKVALVLQAELSKLGPIVGFTSLAEGSDQLFAQCVLDLGGSLNVVIPCAEYETTFETSASLDKYHELLQAATAVEELSFAAPSEEAFWQAGRRVAEKSEQMFAVWDGKPAGGLGGTADVVAYARELGKPVLIIWPPGSSRKN